MTIQFATAVSPVNIAVIKYWGKRDENLILPINDSISVTLSKKVMCAKTTVACSDKFEADRMWLNGKEQDIQTPRIQNCIRELKKRAKNKQYVNWPLHISSENNFPTAAGLASSAAGFACLVKALAALYDVEDDLSVIARQGSGSACRSIYGGFVHWLAGTKDDGTDSFAQPIASKDHWPELRALILVVSANKKETSSTKGMQQSVLTSNLLQYRVSEIVPKRIEQIRTAILNNDFQTFAEITMKESNQFHAICLDTFPPVHYLNSISYKIIRLMHLYNELSGEYKVAYTFDAGPNACLYLLKKDVPEMISIIRMAFPRCAKNAEYIKGLEVPAAPISKELLDRMQITPQPNAIDYIIHTQVGNGPIIIQEQGHHLLNEEGLPLSS